MNKLISHRTSITVARSEAGFEKTSNCLQARFFGQNFLRKKSPKICTPTPPENAFLLGFVPL